MTMSVVEENCNYRINICEILDLDFQKYEVQVNELSNNVLKLIEDSFLQSINYQVCTAQSHDEEHKLLMDKNRLLRQEIDTKLKELSRKQTQYERFKLDQKLLTQEIKETHEAFLMAKKYFKKFLKMYYSIETRLDDEQVIYVQFFSEAKKDSENYSVRLTRSNKSKQYNLISTTPKLKIIKDIQQILLETNDVPGALFCIREEFLALKGSKKLG